MEHNFGQEVVFYDHHLCFLLLHQIVTERATNIFYVAVLPNSAICIHILTRNSVVKNKDYYSMQYTINLQIKAPASITSLQVSCGYLFETNVVYMLLVIYPTSKWVKGLSLADSLADLLEPNSVICMLT